VLQSMVLWWLASQMAGTVSTTGGRSLDLYHTCCMVGYCMVPQIVNSGAALMLRRCGGTVAVPSVPGYWWGRGVEQPGRKQVSGVPGYAWGQ
jgi:hypothetical protein